MTFTPDDKRVASASADGTVKMWDVMTGQETLSLEWDYFGYGASGVDISPDGTRIASAGSDGMVKIWDSRPWTPELRTQSQSRVCLNFHRDRVKSLEELQETVRSDKTINELVRQQALDWAELFWKNHNTENE